MKIKTALLVLVLLTNAHASSGWFSYSDDPGFTNNLMGKCGEDKSPAEYMKHHDDLGTPYLKENEHKDTSGKVESITIVKRPGGNQERTLFFRNIKNCEASYKVAAEKENAGKQKSKHEEKKKYGDYQ